MIGKTASFAIILFCIFFHFKAAAQESNEGFTTSFLGIGSGYSFQLSDTKNSSGWGVNLSSMKYLKEQTFKRLILYKGYRFDYANNHAYDHRPVAVNNYRNVLFRHLSAECEFGATHRRIEELSGLKVGAYIGAGFLIGYVSTDRKDQNNVLYDYSGIDPKWEKKWILDAIKDIVDGKYETSVEQRVCLIPSVGCHLSYEITPGIQLKLDHRMRFSLTESNSLIGINMDNMEIPSSFLDMTNFTSFGFVFTIQNKIPEPKPRGVIRHLKDRKEKRKDPSVSDTIEEQGNAMRNMDYLYGFEGVDLVREYQDIYPIFIEPDPEFVLLGSDTIPYFAGDTLTELIAWVKEVDFKEQIQITLNEQAVDFEYNPSSGLVRAYLSTERDTGYLHVECWNSSDMDILTRELYFVRQAYTERPGVTILQPLTSPFCSNEESCLILAKIWNVDSLDDIYVEVNGEVRDNFEFSFSDGILRLRLSLLDKKNKVLIKVSNSSGEDSDTRHITLENNQCAFPETL